MTTTIGTPLVRFSLAGAVVVEGELDACSVPILRDAVRSLPAGPRHIDASRVSFAGTAILGALIELQAECEPGALTITSSPALARLIGLAGLAGEPPFC